MCFTLVHDLALGSSVIIAVNLYFMQILLLVQCDGFPTSATVASGSVDKCHKIPPESCRRAESSRSRCPLSRCIYSAFPFIKGLKVAVYMCARTLVIRDDLHWVFWRHRSLAFI